MHATSLFLAAAALATGVRAQLTTTVGPTTPLSQKTYLCNVLDYGGAVGSADIGPAIQSAHDNCVLKNAGSTLYVPAGSYSMKTWVTLNGASKWAFRLDGFITRTATTGGHMVVIENAKDVEFYSANSAGGFQGNGYQCRNAGPRFVRIITSTSWSLHDLIFVDSPEFHVIIDNSVQGEIYNVAIRGADIGGSDGIDVTGTNVWVHDVEVTNRDECVTVKSPSSNILVERIWCNQSGGSAIGSLGTGTAISNVLYRNVYTNGGNQAFMIKSNGGSGTVSNVLFQNFISRGVAYGLDIDQYWSSETTAAGAGVALSNIEFQNWDGYVVDGSRRAPVQLICADGAPCANITLSNVNMWASNNVASAKCRSAYGSGIGCIHANSGSHTSYAATTSSYGKPGGYSTPTTMAGDLSAGFGSTAPIPTPTIPTAYYPGLAQISPLAKNKSTAPASSTTKPATSTTPPTSTTTSSGSSSTGAPQYGQCGGEGWTGPTSCVPPFQCTVSNPYYSQCI